MIVRRSVVSALLLCVLVAPAAAQEITYRVSVPQPEHHWLQVEATFTGVQPPLELRMSRSSPGRYALHEFAKNVYDVRADDGRGHALEVTRVDPYGWAVASAGTVRVFYKVFGDTADGTYLAVDPTHAHMNMPATFMWARGMMDRPIRVSFEPPRGSNWTIATQLFPTSDPRTFTAPNLQYFMDSPTELGPVWQHEIRIPQPDGSGEATFRIALHHAGTERDAAQYASGIEKIAAEEAAIFGEFPAYEPGFYTVLADRLPTAAGDGMEHRNSTVVTSRNGLAQPRALHGALEAVAHELFHCWNVERIRPAALEPFDFERANMSGELWLAEGFTNYYGSLVMQRSGLSELVETLAGMGSTINAIANGAGRQVRTAAEMSQMAPFVDAARSMDATNFDITFISYYTWGEGLGLALDLSLRDSTGGRVTLDDYMRAMWRAHGKPGGSAPGLVARPYTIDDARARLAEVSGDARFAEEFFSRYVLGHEVPDYARLLARAGLILRRRNPGAASLGSRSWQNDSQGLRISTLTAPGTPLYEAGLDEGDVIVSIRNKRVTSNDDVTAAIAANRPGESIAMQVLRRGATTPAVVTLTLTKDPELELVTVESTGGRLTSEQQAFRSAWLGSHVAVGRAFQARPRGPEGPRHPRGSVS